MKCQKCCHGKVTFAKACLPQVATHVLCSLGTIKHLSTSQVIIVEARRFDAVELPVVLNGSLRAVDLELNKLAVNGSLSV